MADAIPHDGAPSGMVMDPEFEPLLLGIRPFDPASYDPDVHVLPPDDICQFKRFARGAPEDVLLRKPELHLSYGAAEVCSSSLLSAM